MYQISQAIDNNIKYTQLPGGGWRATFAGALRASAEGATPRQAGWALEKELERRIAEWIVGRPGSEVPPAPAQGAAGRKRNKAVPTKTQKVRRSRRV